MADQILAQLERLGFPDVLLWLLTFAVVFGILEQADIPKKSKASRGIIAMGMATLVMLSAPASLIVFLSTFSSGMILVVIALLVLIAFFEATGLQKVEDVLVGQDEKGNPKFDKQKVSFFGKHSTVFALSLIIVVALIFLGAGGWELLGFGNITLKGIGSESMLGIIFLAAVVIGVLWMIMESGKD